MYIIYIRNIFSIAALFIFISPAVASFDTNYRIASGKYNVDINVIRAIAMEYSGERQYMVSIKDEKFPFFNLIEATNFLDTIKTHRWFLNISKGEGKFKTLNSRVFFLNKMKALEWLESFDSDYAFELYKVNLENDVRIGLMGIPYKNGVPYKDLFLPKNNVSMGTKILKLKIDSFGLKNGIRMYFPSNRDDFFEKNAVELYEELNKK